MRALVSKDILVGVDGPSSKEARATIFASNSATSTRPLIRTTSNRARSEANGNLDQRCSFFMGLLLAVLVHDRCMNGRVESHAHAYGYAETRHDDVSGGSITARAY